MNTTNTDAEATYTDPEYYNDALELAFDQVKEIEANVKDPKAFPKSPMLAQLWVNLAIAVELRRLRTALQAMHYGN